MPLGDIWRIEVRGNREVERALGRMERGATREARAGAVRLSRTMANKIRARGRGDTAQSRRASRTVRAATVGIHPGVTAGPHELLFGSEFGAYRRFGWYAAARYRGSPRRQFRRHIGNAGYWFHPEVRNAEPEARAANREILDAIVRQWGT